MLIFLLFFLELFVLMMLIKQIIYRVQIVFAALKQSVIRYLLLFLTFTTLNI